MTLSVIVTHADRHYPAELVGTAGQAMFTGDGYLPKSFLSAKQARRWARKKYGAGSLDARKWRPVLARGQSIQCGHIVAIEVMT